MTARDRETSLAVDALVHRLRNRGDGDNQFATDDEPFAAEFMTSLAGRGWRPVEALAPWDARGKVTGDKRPVSEETRREVEEARRAIDVARERLRAEAAARTEAGDAA